MRCKSFALLGALVVGLALLNPVVAEGAGRTKTRMSVSVSDRTPTVGQKVTVSGKVKPRKVSGKKRRIRLQQRIDGAWRTLRQQRVRKGGYRFSITTTTSGTRRYRLVVRKARGVTQRKKRFTLRTHGLPTTVTARYSKRKVRLGAKVTVRGAVTGPANRVVTLYRALPSGPRAIKSKPVNSKGGYVFRVPTSFLVNHKLFVNVRATATHAADNSVPRKFTVLPSWKLQGKATSWRHLRNPSGLQVRVNPCATVRYRVNLRALKPKARPKALRELGAATRRITRATGIQFKRVGKTSFIPRARNKAHRRYPANTTLVVSWARQKQTTLDFGPAVGYGGGDGVYGRTANGTSVFLRTKGWVAIEHPSRVPNGYADGGHRGALMMHEIGHVIGLHHPKAKNQIMSAVMNPKITSRWSAGDVRGLRAVGIDHGCISRARSARRSVNVAEPEPHPVTYADRH